MESKFETIFLVLFFVECSNIAGSTQILDNLKISTSKGVYFQELDNVKVYEYTIPLIYYFKLPDIDNENDIMGILKETDECVDDKRLCLEIKNDIQDITRMYNELTDMRNDIIREFRPATPKRVKRGWQWLGDIDHWCCNVLTEVQGQEFRNTEGTLKEGYEKLRSAVIDDHAALLNVTTETKIFNEKIVKNTNDLRDAIRQISKYLNLETDINTKRDNVARVSQMYLNSAFVQTHKLQYLFSSCKDHYLPMAIVKEEVLIDDLKKIQKKVKWNNYELALDSEKNLKYYHHSKLINCFIHENEVEIEIKIPLKNRGTEYHVYDFHPLQFKSHQGQICQWDQEPMLLIHDIRKNIALTISGNELELCNRKNDLCFISQNRVGSAQSICAKLLFLQKNSEEIIKSCMLKCNLDHGEAIVKQIDREIFALTNARNPIMIKNTITQNTTEIRINETWPGAVIVTVPCSSEVSHLKKDNSTEILISQGLPCFKATPRITVEHHLPVVWTQYKFMETDSGIHQTVKFPNLSVIYDPEWTLKVPHFTPITNNVDFSKNLKNFSELQKEGRWYADTYSAIMENPVSSFMSFWIIILTIITIYIWVRLNIISTMMLTNTLITELRK